MWQVSPVALGPTMRSTLTTFPMKGFLGPKVFMGRPISSSSRGTSARFNCRQRGRGAASRVHVGVGHHRARWSVLGCPVPSC